MQRVDHDIQGLPRSEPIKPRLCVSIFNTLHDAGDANLDKLIEVAGGNGEELDPFEQGILGILGFFEHPAVEAQPRFIATDKETLWILVHIVHNTLSINEKRPSPDASKSQTDKSVPQGSSAREWFESNRARLKSCPDIKPIVQRPVSPVTLSTLLKAQAMNRRSKAQLCA